MVQETQSSRKSDDIEAELKKTLSTVPQKGIVNFLIPALIPIATSKEWSNADSIHSYSPAEFTSRITNVQNRKTSVYEVLQNFREGTNLKKSNMSEKSVADLISDPKMYDEIEQLYKELESTLPPPRKISLPYTTNHKERMNTLVPRIAEIYNIDKTKQPSYRIEYGYYDDGIVQYPFEFEILGVPLANPIEDETKFIGAINYSVSPNGIRFEGQYHIDQDEVARILLLTKRRSIYPSRIKPVRKVHY
jgi:hypothetical protein